jgi:hypothetical protein
MNCKGFTDRIFLFQADELDSQEREVCQQHLDGCERCAERLRVEQALVRTLTSRLSRTPAPPGLETRVREALRAQASPGREGGPWYQAPWFAATAAALLLVAVLVPGLMIDWLPEDAGGIAVHETVTVVDLDCDQAGYDLDAQRGCRHPHHINALKRADGSYWSIDPEQPEFRYLLLDREVRGQQLVVRGRLFPENDLVQLTAVETLEVRLATPWSVAGHL